MAVLEDQLGSPRRFSLSRAAVIRPALMSSAFSWRPITIASDTRHGRGHAVRFLGELHRHGIERREPRRHLAGDALQFDWAVGDAIDEPVLQQMLGRKGVRRQQILERNTRPRQVRQDCGVDRCRKAAAHLERAEPGSALGNDEIAAHGEREASGDGMPFHDRHRRLGEAVQQVQDVGPILVVGEDLGQRRIVACIAEVAPR